MTKPIQTTADPDGAETTAERATSPMESVDKALQALDILSTADGDGMALGALANALGLKKNSLHRTLSALRYRGFVVQDGETGNYQLGPSLLRLADNYLSEGRLRVLFHSILQEICAEVNELCHLGILDGTDIVYMDKVEPEQSIRVWSAVGRRNPAVSTAPGLRYGFYTVVLVYTAISIAIKALRITRNSFCPRGGASRSHGWPVPSRG